MGKQVSREDKRRAVKQYIQDGHTSKSLAAEYGVSRFSVTNWVNQYREECQKDAKSNADLNTMKEVAKLRQIAALKKENEFLKKQWHFCESNRLVACRFIDENKGQFGLRWLLKRLRIYPNAYYNYLRQRKAEYREKKELTQSTITRIYHEMVGILGHRSMKVFLSREGIFLSKTTVYKCMNKELKLYSICRWKRSGYRKGKANQIFPNLLKQKFLAPAQNKVWCTDFTYIFLTNGTLRFNCTIIDLFDRSVVASENGKWIPVSLPLRH